MTSDTQKPDVATPARKPYQAPHLEVYGDLRTVTQAVSTTGAMSDGGMGTNKKT